MKNMTFLYTSECVVVAKMVNIQKKQPHAEAIKKIVTYIAINEKDDKLSSTLN